MYFLKQNCQAIDLRYRTQVFIRKTVYAMYFFEQVGLGTIDAENWSLKTVCLLLLISLQKDHQERIAKNKN